MAWFAKLLQAMGLRHVRQQPIYSHTCIRCRRPVVAWPGSGEILCQCEKPEFLEAGNRQRLRGVALGYFEGKKVIPVTQEAQDGQS